MKCPNKCGDLETTIAKRVEFNSDDAPLLDIQLEFCPICNYVHQVWVG